MESNEDIVGLAEILEGLTEQLCLTSIIKIIYRACNN